MGDVNNDLMGRIIREMRTGKAAEAETATTPTGDAETIEGLRADGTERLCQAVYKRKATASDYIGGSEARMLHDATDLIGHLREAAGCSHARGAERDQECSRLEGELKSALELINALNTNAAALREKFVLAKGRALTAEFAIAACARFLKDGETPAQRIERLHGEISGMMTTLEGYTDRALAAEARALRAESQVAEAKVALAEGEDKFQKQGVMDGNKIGALKGQIALLAAALRPFAHIAEMVADQHPGWDHDGFEMPAIGGFRGTLEPYRRARSTLANLETKEPTP